MNNQIEKAVKILNQGGIIIFPTDTAFGIGCRIDKENSIQKLFKIRKRPESQAVPVLVSNLEMAKGYANIPEEVIQKLIKPYWPGALTIVLEVNKHKVPALARGGGETVGVRVPNHPTILGIIEKVGVPILGPSANFHREPTPYDFKSLSPKLISLVNYVVEGECLLKNASTVIDCTKTPWQILRQGAIEIKI
jgi:L-threonylcarbamoyladenylate synthase